MKLKDLLGDTPVDIEYRTYDPFGEDILTGACRWTGSELISVYGDNYSTEDYISKHRWNHSNSLTIWYESKWIAV